MTYHESKPTVSYDTSDFPSPEWSPYPSHQPSPSTSPSWGNSDNQPEPSDQFHPSPKSGSLFRKPQFSISNKTYSKLFQNPRISILKIKYSIHINCGPSYPPQNLTLTPLEYEYDLYVPPYLNPSICRSYETEQYSRYLTYLVRTFNVKIRNINNWPCICCHNPARHFATIQRNCLGFNAFHVSYKPEIVNVVIVYCNNGGECEVKANMLVKTYKGHFLKMDGECLDCRILKTLGEMTEYGAARYCSEECGPEKQAVSFE